jgi:hypothetical protein
MKFKVACSSETPFSLEDHCVTTQTITQSEEVETRVERGERGD